RECTAAIDARSAHGPYARPRSRSVRPQHRRSREPLAPDAARRRARAAHRQNRLRRRLRDRCTRRAERRVKLKFVPETLFGRLLMALLATIGITLVIVVALLLRERRDLLVARSDTAAIVNVIAETVEELAMLAPDEREEAIERLRREPLAIDSARAQGRQAAF